jgi:predicted O-methyltransferase YrrM
LYSPLTILKKYLHYRITSSNGKGHGVHSPFVFDFIDKVLNGKKERVCYKEIESLRESLLKDKTIIEVEDFGAGSSVIKTNKRRIDKIAASSLKSKKFAQLLHQIIEYYKPNHIIELGTSFGITSSYLAKANPSVIVDTFEGSSAIAQVARRNFEKLKINNINLHEGDFAKTFNTFLNNQNRIDFVFIDGNHKKEPTTQYFNMLLDKCSENTILVFDDIHWSKEMEEAWDFIKDNDAVTLSIDLFFVGILFFRQDFKVKQHFSIQF